MKTIINEHKNSLVKVLALVILSILFSSISIITPFGVSKFVILISSFVTIGIAIYGFFKIIDSL